MELYILHRMTDIYRKRPLLLYALLVLFPFVYWCALHFITGFNGLTSPEAHIYRRFGLLLHDSLVSGNTPGDFWQPVIFPLGGAILSFLFGGDATFSLQAVSFLAFSGSGLLLFMHLNREYRETTKAFVFVVIAFLLSPLLLRNSVVILPDMLCMFFITCCFILLRRLRTQLTALHYMLYVFCCGAAIMTRYGAAFILVIPSLWLALRCIRKGRWQLLLAGLLPFALAFLPAVLLHGSRITELIQPAGSTGYGWSMLNYFRSGYNGPDGVVDYVLPNILYYAGALLNPKIGLLLLLMLVSGILLIRHGTYQRLLLWAVVTYILFIAGYPGQHLHLFILLMPVLLLYAWPCFSESRFYTTLPGKAVYGVVIAGAAFFAWAGTSEMTTRNKTERELTILVQQHTDESTLIVYTLDVDAAMENYNVGIPLINMRKQRIGGYSEGGAVLFNETKYANDTGIPGENWKALKTNYTLQVMAKHPEGWVLYRILPKLK